ncbi:MAG: sensor histidine kinase [Magnetococcales bacterium]|nr:sensor histidine kinase [Magnetococcales bacterium]NGZ07160.1 sensor histidine kinase [Magnetococcales bacterium]
MNAAPSLQKRLAMALVAILVPVFLGQWWFMSVAVERVHAEHVASRLAHDAEALLAVVVVEGSGPIRLLAGRLEQIHVRPWSGHYFRIQEGDTVLWSRSWWDFDVSSLASTEAEETIHALAGPNGQSLLGLQRTFHKAGRVVRILVAEEIGLSTQTVRAIQWWHAGIALLALVAVLWLQRVVVQRVLLDPIRRVTVEVGQLEQGMRSHLDAVSVFVEIVPFVTEINRLLGVLTARLLRSRQASANLAHAIKTPLALLMQWTQGDELAGHVALQQKMQYQIATVSALTSRVLKRMRVAGPVVGGVRVDLVAELTTLVEMMRQMPHARVLQIETVFPEPFHPRMDREDLLELVGNLLDNGCKWARHRVRCVVERVDGGEGWVVRVEDDGPGCPVEHYASILAYGARGDFSVPGHGIGLAVVQEIVSSYHGTLTLERSVDLGGLAVVILMDSFPPPS